MDDDFSEIAMTWGWSIDGWLDSAGRPTEAEELDQLPAGKGEGASIILSLL